MNNFLKIRNRTLRILVLGLVVIMFVTYCRTTSNEANPSLALQIFAWKDTSEAQNVSLNGTSESSSSRDPVHDSPSGGSNVQRSANETIASTAMSSGNSMAQGSSSSSHVASGSNKTIPARTDNKLNERTVSSGKTPDGSSQETTLTTATTTTGRTSKIIEWPTNSTGAMYPEGHDVTAADKCPAKGENLTLAIVISSAPAHAEARTAIRQTWGHYGQRNDVAIVFIIGETNDTKVEKLINLEEKLYGDVVRGRFYDSYTNLTLKTVSTLEWVKNYCSGARYVLKTDDDMFINVPRLLAFARTHEREKNIIYGRLARKWKPFRNWKSKYYVPLYQFKGWVFPDFTTGPAYLMSSDVVPKLYDASLPQTYLKLEDVFMTGIIAEKIGVLRRNANEFLNRRTAHTACSVQRAISIHMVKYKEQFDLWKKLLDGTTKCKT